MRRSVNVDVTELILFQHHEQRRMFALVDDVERSNVRTLKPVWTQLTVLLEVHAKAEEKFFYPRLLDVGTGAGGEGSAGSETKDAIKDHNEIRDAITEAGRHRVGSDDWWNAVVEARIANSDHMAEEEREDLADFRRHASLQVRHEIAVQFVAYEAENAGGIIPRDQDPAAYVGERG